jgi:hypothetical protein
MANCQNVKMQMYSYTNKNIIIGWTGNRETNVLSLINPSLENVCLLGV